jgi:hypothetical protein
VVAFTFGYIISVKARVMGSGEELIHINMTVSSLEIVIAHRRLLNVSFA